MQLSEHSQYSEEKKMLDLTHILWFSRECPRPAITTVCFKSDSAIVLYNICSKNSPIVSMGEILTVQFNTTLYESELKISLEGTWNTGLCLCHTDCAPKVRQEWEYL